MRFASTFAISLWLGFFASGCVALDGGWWTWDSSFYEVCWDSRDCSWDTDGCFEIIVDYGWIAASDRMCTSYCTSDWDCPYDGACYALSSVWQWNPPPLCYQRCKSHWECPWGFACMEVHESPYESDHLCLPY